VYVLGPVPSSALDSGLRPDRNKTCDGFVAGGQPEADCYTHRSTGSAGELVSITPDASECWSASNSSCVYIIGVYSFSPTQYTITTSSDEATELLFPNTASLNILRGETHKKYRFRVSADERLRVLLTPFAGNPDLFARFGRPLEAGLKGKGSALVQVDPRGSAMRYLLLAYAAKDADEYAALATSLQQRVSLDWSDSSDGGSLSLSFDAAPPPAASGWTTTYEV